MVYEWKINALDCEEDVVKAIHWSLLYREENIKEEIYGRVVVPSPDLQHYTAFSELSKDQVIGWLESSLGLAEITRLKDVVKKRLEMRNKTKPTPWS